MKTFEAVECTICHKFFKANSGEFILLKGGIYKGSCGGLLGGVPNRDGEPHTSVYCSECFIKAIQNAFSDDFDF